MPTGSNLYRSKNYQDYVNHGNSKTKLEKSISDVENQKNDGDNESINSCAESLNNYLDVKVDVISSSIRWITFLIHHW